MFNKRPLLRTTEYIYRMSENLTGSLSVFVHEASDLRNHETFGKQDPYVILTLKGDSKRTKVHKKGGKNPKWGENFKFSLDGTSRSEKLLMELFDDDMGKDDFIGTCEVDLRRAVGESDLWLPVIEDNGKPRGKIHIVCAFKEKVVKQPRPTPKDAPSSERESERQTADSDRAGGGRGEVSNIEHDNEPLDKDRTREKRSSSKRNESPVVKRNTSVEKSREERRTSGHSNRKEPDRPARSSASETSRLRTESSTKSENMFGVEKLETVHAEAQPSSFSSGASRYGRGSLHIEVVNAKGLRNHDTFNQDPFASVSFQGQEEKTSIHKKGGKNPEWNETLSFSVTDRDWSPSSSDLVKVDLFDYDGITSNDFIGSVSVSTKDLLGSGEGKSFWVDVIEKNGKPRGTLHLKATFEKEPELTVETKRAEVPQKEKSSSSRSEHQLDTDEKVAVGSDIVSTKDGSKTGDTLDAGVIVLYVDEARGLRNHEVMMDQDPYVVVTVEGASRKTKVHKSGGKNPKWNETLEWVIPKGGCSTETVVVAELFDEDPGKDDFIGRVSIPLRVLLSGENQWFAVVEENGKLKGELRLRCSILEADAEGETKTGEQVRGEGDTANSPSATGVAAGNIPVTDDSQFCESCDGEAVASFQCKECDDMLYCRECDEEAHSVGKFRKHKRVRVAPSTSDSAIHAVPQKSVARMAPGRLVVSLVEADGLRNHELFGKQSPFVIVKVGGTTKQTDPCKKGGSEPRWNTDLPFPMDEEWYQSEALHLELYDKETIKSSNDFIGSVDVSLGEVLDKGQLWLDVVEKNGKTHGRIKVGVTFTAMKVKTKAEKSRDEVAARRTAAEESEKPKNDTSSLDEKTAMSASSTSSSRQDGGTASQKGNEKSRGSASDPLGPGIVHLTFHSGRDLNDQDSFGEKQDPYVIATILNEKQKTSVHKAGGVSPVWEEQLSFNGPSLSTTGWTGSEQVLLQVYDKDRLSDDFIGDHETTVSALLGGGRQWIELFRGKRRDKSAGEICISSSFSKASDKQVDMSKDATAATSSPSSSSSTSVPELKRGLLTVYIDAGRDLKNCEVVGKQDPYVCVTFNDKTKKTKVITKGGSDPVWKEKVVFNVEEGSASPDSEVLIEIYDKDTLLDDLVGLVKAPLSVLYGPSTWRPVRLSSKSDKQKGEIGIGINFTAVEEEHVIANDVVPTNEDQSSEVVGPGILNINLGCGKDLTDHDFGSQQDPYVTIAINGQKKKSKVHNGGGENPVWNQDLPFTIQGRGWLLQDKVVINVYDEDVDEDDFIGFHECTLQALIAKGLEWKDIQDRKGKASGKIRLSAVVQKVDPALEKKESEAAAVAMKVDEKSSLGNGVVSLHIHSAQDLKSAQLIGSQDPYVCVSLNGVERKTHTHNDGGKNPKWEEMVKWVNDPKLLWKGSDIIEAIIKDKGTISDSTIGYCDVTLAQVLSAPGAHPFPVFKDKDRKKAAGTLSLSASFLETTQQEVEVPEELKAVASKRIGPGVLRFNVHSARDLKDCDIGSAQDPFVIVSVNGKQRQTKVHEAGGVNPYWNQFLEMNIDEEGWNESDEVEFFLCDKDTVGHDEIGFCVASVGDLLNAADTQGEWIQVYVGNRKKKKTWKKKGELRVVASFSEESPKTKAEFASETVNPSAKLGQGTFTVMVRCAKGIKDCASFMSKQDPYVTVSVNGKTQKTDVHDNGGCDPSWNQALKFNFSDEDGWKGGDEVNFEIYDKDTLTDSRIGTAAMCIADLASFDQWIDVVSDGQRKGKLRIGASYNKTEKVLREASKMKAMRSNRKIGPGSLIICVEKAWDLIKCDLLGKQDPFVVLTINGVDKQTSVKDGAGEAAEWQETLKFDIDEQGVFLSDAVLIQVLDKDVVGKDLIGQYESTIEELLQPESVSFDIRTSKGGAAGHLSLSTSFVKLEAAKAVEVPPFEVLAAPGVLSVTVVCARGIKDCDIGKQDPYTVVKIGSWEATSTVAKKGGVDPNWNETLKIEHDKDLFAKDRVEFLLFDEDGLKDDEIGTCSIRLLDLVTGGLQWISVLNPKGKVEGKLQVRASHQVAKVTKTVEEAVRKPEVVAETLPMERAEDKKEEEKKQETPVKEGKGDVGDMFDVERKIRPAKARAPPRITTHTILPKGRSFVPEEPISPNRDRSHDLHLKWQSKSEKVIHRPPLYKPPTEVKFPYHRSLACQTGEDDERKRRGKRRSRRRKSPRPHSASCQTEADLEDNGPIDLTASLREFAFRQHMEDSERQHEFMSRSLDLYADRDLLDVDTIDRFLPPARTPPPPLTHNRRRDGSWMSSSLDLEVMREQRQLENDDVNRPSSAPQWPSPEEVVHADAVESDRRRRTSRKESSLRIHVDDADAGVEVEADEREFSDAMRKIRLEALKEQRAARAIQRAFRRFLGEKYARHEAAIRATIVRRQQRNRAARSIQKTFRHFVHRKGEKARIQSRKIAAARKAQKESEKHAATTIQAAYRGFRCRKYETAMARKQRERSQRAHHGCTSSDSLSSSRAEDGGEVVIYSFLKPPQLQILHLHNNILYWNHFEDRHDTVIRGQEMHISEIEEVLAGKESDVLLSDEAAAAPDHCCFSVIAKHCSIHAQVPSEDVRDMWIDLLTDTISSFESQKRSTNRALASRSPLSHSLPLPSSYQRRQRPHSSHSSKSSRGVRTFADATATVLSRSTPAPLKYIARPTSEMGSLPIQKDASRRHKLKDLSFRSTSFAHEDIRGSYTPTYKSPRSISSKKKETSPLYASSSYSSKRDVYTTQPSRSTSSSRSSRRGEPLY